MSQIRSENTKPEIAVRRILHFLGYRFRLHRRDLPGKPDIVLPKYKTVIFVHGCFWHRHKNCRYSYNPKSRIEFWQDKFAANIERDKQSAADLKMLGWQQLVIWECETKDPENIRDIIERFFGKA